MHLTPKYSDSAAHTIEFRVVPTLNHTIVLEMTFLHKFSPTVYNKDHTITWQHPQLTSVSPPVVPAIPLD